MEMYTVLVSPEAKVQFVQLPLTIQMRIQVIFRRLVLWPDVSGAKPLRHGLKGSYRIRTGDYRVLFTVALENETIVIYRIAHRRDVYE